MELCHKWLVHYLGQKVLHQAEHAHGGVGSAKQQTALALVRLKARPFLMDQLPVMMRSSLLMDTADYILRRSLVCGSDYGKAILFLLYLLLSKEVKKLRITLCCYYGCRDMDAVLRCIKKNGASLEHLELSRSSLLRMDPLLFRNVLTSASNLTSLVVKNITSDAMLKLIGAHCRRLEFLVVSNSKQISDAGIEALCGQVHIRDRRLEDKVKAEVVPFQMVPEMPVNEDFGGADSPGFAGNLRNAFKTFFEDISSCISAGIDEEEPNRECLVEIKQVLHPLCNTLRVLDITDTSVTSTALISVLKKVNKLQTFGEFCLSDHFLRSLSHLTATQREKSCRFTCIHARKVTQHGMSALILAMPRLDSFNCWDPQFDLAELVAFKDLTSLSLYRMTYSDATMSAIMSFLEDEGVRERLEKLCLEFVAYEGYYHGGFRRVNDSSFDLSSVISKCQRLKIFNLEFKDNSVPSPQLGFDQVELPYVSQANRLGFPGLSTLVHVQLGQVVLNETVATILKHCSRLKHFHCNICPGLSDRDLSKYCYHKSCINLECFYIYEAPQLTFSAFQILVDAFPSLKGFGNLTRWALGCEGIRQVTQTITENNFNVEVLTGSHWFSGNCCQTLEPSGEENHNRYRSYNWCMARKDPRVGYVHHSPKGIWLDQQ